MGIASMRHLYVRVEEWIPNPSEGYFTAGTCGRSKDRYAVGHYADKLIVYPGQMITILPFSLRWITCGRT